MADINVTPPELSEYDKKKFSILRNAYEKLSSLPLSFGMPAYDEAIPNETIDKYFKVDFMDTLRETRLSLDDIESGSMDEMQFENRIVYHTIKRFRLTSSVFFKFSTAVDGKSIDKTQIPKMLTAVLNEYDAEYKKWRSGSCGSIWNKSAKS